MSSPLRLLPLATLALAVACLPEARAGDLEDATALARKVAEAHRSDEHRARYDLVLPEARAVARGWVRVEARGGRFAVEESGTTLEVGDSEARVALARRTHVPTFAARAAGKRDEGSLQEATLSPARGRVALVACALLAGARERPRGTVEGPGDARDPDVKLESDAEGGDDWPRLALEVDGRKARRRGPYAELARRVLEEVAASAGLARPLDATAASARLLRDLGDPDAAPRAAFLLGELGCATARPELAKLPFTEARDATAKLAALASETPARSLLEAAATGSWDVRSWARERLEAAPATRGQWPWAVLEHEPAAATDDEALAEALHALGPPGTDARRARVHRLLEHAGAGVRVEAAAALLRWDDDPRAREVLVAVARDERADPDAREDAVARIASLLGASELVRALGPVLASPSAEPLVRAQVARALDRAACVAAIPALAETLEAEVQRTNRAASPEAARDLRVALVQALASIASVTTATLEALEPAAQALGIAAAADPEEDLRALAIHACGALPRELGLRGARATLDAEKARPTTSLVALRAAELEDAATSAKTDRERLEAIADSACEAPLRSTLARAVAAARDPVARAALVARLRARGPAGESALEALGER